MLRKDLVRMIVVLLAVIFLSLLFFFYPVNSSGFYPKCIFHSITGFDCPGCGSQRAASALIHGHFLDAVNYNLLFILFIPLLLYSAYVFIWNTFSKRKIKQQLVYSPLFIKSVLLIVIAFWVLRNIPVAPFNWLKA